MPRAHRPPWMDDPHERRDMIRYLIEQGVTRVILMNALNLSIGQMAGEARRAGVQFSQQNAATPDRIRELLFEAGIPERVVRGVVPMPHSKPEQERHPVAAKPLKAPTGTRLRFAVSEKSQCQFPVDEKTCALEAEPASDPPRCPMHRGL